MKYTKRGWKPLNKPSALSYPQKIGRPDITVNLRGAHDLIPNDIYILIATAIIMESSPRSEYESHGFEDSIVYLASSRPPLF